MIKYCCYFLVVFSLTIINSYSQPIVRFAAIGDYGRWYTPGEILVSQMLHGWNPDLIITLGDNNYEFGADSTIDSNIGQFYHDYIFPYNGSFGNGSPYNRFYPALGNHDWITDSARPYLNYFQLPGNERYYDFVAGNVHFFALDSDVNEPDGNTSSSAQAMWLMNRLAVSNSRFKIVYFHHPPYSSGMHGNNADMKWPFKQWGATVIFCGHEHNYERLVDSTGMTYFVNGLGGKDWREFSTIVPESRFRFTGNYGAMLVTSYTDSLNIKFIAFPDSLKDDTTIVLPPIGIATNQENIRDFSLDQNYPNPFNPETLIRFSLDKSSELKLVIYNSNGEFIDELINAELNAGKHEIKWSAGNLPSGVYYCTISSWNGTLSRKMVLLK